MPHFRFSHALRLVLVVSGILALSGCISSLDSGAAAGATDTLGSFVAGLSAASEVDTAAADELPGGLTQDQIDQLKALHEQLLAGEITRDEFLMQVKAIVGDALPPPRAPFHHGFRHPPLTAVAPKLDLTAEQKTQAEAIFSQARTDIQGLRTAAREQVRNLLTDEQKAIFDRLLPPIDEAGVRIEASAEIEKDTTAAGSRRFGGGRPGHDLPPPPGAAAELLGLTDEQQTQIDAIHAQLRTDVQARLDKARADFRAILTDEQIATLDAFEAAHPILGAPNDLLVH